MLKGSIDEAREAQKVGAATEQIIKSTGGAAGITADQVGAMAGRLSSVTGIDDEVIQQSSNLLLTFKNVKNYVDGQFVGAFDRATAAAVDLSAAGFGSTDSAAKMLGKALNDPLKGISALGRAGVTFSDAQKEQIKGFVESGDAAKAQNLILKEVESQVGGVAAATATSGEKAAVAFGNIKEAAGTALLPLVDTIARQFLKLAPSIQKAIANIGPTFQRVRAFVQPFIASIATTIANLGTQLAPVVVTIATAVATFVGQIKSGTGAGGAFASIISALASALGTVFGFISANQAVVGTFVGVIAAAAAAAKLFAAAQLLVNIALSANPIGLVVIAIAALVAGLVYAYKNSETFRNVVNKAFSVVKSVATSVAGFLSKYVPKAFSVIAKVVGTYVTVYKTVVVTAFNIVKSVVSKVADFVVASAQKYSQFSKIVNEKVGQVVKFFRELPGKIKGFLTSLPGELKTIGGNIISGLVNGIKAAAGKVNDAVQAIINKIPKKIRQIMGIASPSKVTTELGQFIGDGLAAGMKQSEGKVGNAADSLTKKLKEKLGKVRDQLASVRSDFASLVDPIASNFTKGLFDFDTGKDFLANLTSNSGTLTNLLNAFKTLKGYGLSPGFLYQLFESAGPKLILDLAADKATATQAASVFGQNTDLSNQLGTAVASATDKGAALETQTVRLEKKLDKLNDSGKDNAKMIAEALSRPSANARRRSRSGGGRR